MPRTASPYKRLGLNRIMQTRPDGTLVFYSYQTPVAVKMPDGALYITTQKYSVTTSKHCTQFIRDALPVEFVNRVDQGTINSLAGTNLLYR